MSDTNIQEAVKQKYGEAAKRAASGGTACGGRGAELSGCDPITKDLYDEVDKAAVPDKAVAASLGCGNPTALADLKPGDIVLDLGSGGGIDVILSARRVGLTGKAYGLDMTGEMLDLARRNAAEAGVTNVEFLSGHIEEIPLPDSSVDVVISNCVINLSTDKSTVLREVARVLRPGGRFAVSDVVADPDLGDDIRRDMAQWTGCIAGALTADQYRSLLKEAGLTAIEVNETHRVHPHAGSAIIRASRPAEPPGGAPLPPGVVRLQGPGFLHVP